MASWPTITPASSVPTTLPRRKLPTRMRPIVKPMARVRKSASSGFSRSVAIAQSMCRRLRCLLYGGLRRLPTLAGAADRDGTA